MSLSYLIKLFKKRNNPTIKEVVRGEDPCLYYKDEIDEQKQENVRLSERLQRKTNALREERKKVRNKKRLIKDLKREEDHPKAEYWNKKYEKKVVKYRRPIWDGDSLDNEQVPVTVYVQPNDTAIKKAVREEGLTVENPMEINGIAPEIYDYAKRAYEYQYDSRELGRAEFWRMPFEVRAQHGGDCEDWSHVIASYMIAAGVPSWRVRCVAGDTIDQSYGGHCTVYILGDDLETWYHMNSTETEVEADNLTDYPTWGEDKGLNIDPNDVWLAYNDRYSWQQFESEASRQKFESHVVSEKITVEQW